MRLQNPCYSLYQRLLIHQVSRGPPIRHVAVIQDGNRRYAREHGLASAMGHSMGAKTTENVLDWCLMLGIRHLTLYAFSTENFKRNEEEKSQLFSLIQEKLLELRSSEKVHKNRVRVRAIGRIEMLPPEIQEAVTLVEEATRDYQGMYLNVALAYGGQCELVDAARSLAHKIKAGEMVADDIDEALIGRFLYPNDDVPVPEVDLIVRTGGEVRTSNFLPWQANGNECAAYFCAPYWPEFRMIDFLRAIRTAQARRSNGYAQT